MPHRFHSVGGLHKQFNKRINKIIIILTISPQKYVIFVATMTHSALDAPLSPKNLHHAVHGANVIFLGLRLARRRPWMYWRGRNPGRGATGHCAGFAAHYSAQLEEEDEEGFGRSRLGVLGG